MPQMRAVISGASWNWRPLKKASKNRGGSKIFSLTSATASPLTRRYRPPSPSTRARISTLMVLLFMGFALPAELRGVGVEFTEGLHQTRFGDPKTLTEPGSQGGGVGRLLGAIAAVAAPVVGGAQGPAAAVGYRPQTWSAQDHDADVAPSLALQADAVGRQPRGAAAEIGADHLQELSFVDGAAVDLVVHLDMGRQRRGLFQGLDVFRMGVDCLNEIVNVLEVAQGLDAAGAGAGAEGHQVFGVPAYLFNEFGIVGGGDGAVHQGQVVGALAHGPGGLDEKGQFHLVGDGQQLVFAVQERQLAAVAGGEFPDRKPGLFFQGHESDLPPLEPVHDRIVAKDRTVLADEEGPPLAVPAQAQAAFH